MLICEWNNSISASNEYQHVHHRCYLYVHNFPLFLFPNLSRYDRISFPVLVAAKIKTLQEYHTKLLNGILPIPTGFDIVNTLTSLKQSLQGKVWIQSYDVVLTPSNILTFFLVVLKDMPSNILELTQCLDKDSARLALFPAMDYKGLYNALVLLIDDALLIHMGLQGTWYVFLPLHNSINNKLLFTIHRICSIRILYPDLPHSVFGARFVELFTVYSRFFPNAVLRRNA